MKYVWLDELPNYKNYRHGPAPSKWVAEAAAMINHPGKWLLLATVPTSQKLTLHRRVTNIHNGRLSAFRPRGQFEAATRTLGDGTLGLFARYVGTADDQ